MAALLPPCHPAVKYDRIYFTQLGLKDNVAQVVLLQRRRPSQAGSSGSTGSRKRGRSDEPIGMQQHQQEQQQEPRDVGASSDGEEWRRSDQQPLLAVGNIHVLFNPRRGDIKIAQVGPRLLGQRSYPVWHVVGSFAVWQIALLLRCCSWNVPMRWCFAYVAGPPWLAGLSRVGRLHP